MGVIVYYEKGQVVKMSPEPETSYYETRGLINEATSIVSDGIPYTIGLSRNFRTIFPRR